MLEAADRLLRSDTLPAPGGTPVTVLATTTIAELTAAAREGAANGLAVLGTGQTISARELLRLASEANVVPVVLSDAGGVLAYGRSRRLASPGQRLALAARDGGCCFPGCERLPRLPGPHCCRRLPASLPTQRFSSAPARPPVGWDLRMRDGRPEWLPPPWLDPDRTPIRPSTHTRPEPDFRQPEPAA
jgi:hypothetical protein